MVFKPTESHPSSADKTTCSPSTLSRVTSAMRDMIFRSPSKRRVPKANVRVESLERRELMTAEIAHEICLPVEETEECIPEEITLTQFESEIEASLDTLEEPEDLIAYAESKLAINSEIQGDLTAQLKDINDAIETLESRIESINQNQDADPADKALLTSGLQSDLDDLLEKRGLIAGEKSRTDDLETMLKDDLFGGFDELLDEEDMSSNEVLSLFSSNDQAIEYLESRESELLDKQESMNTDIDEVNSAIQELDDDIAEVNAEEREATMVEPKVRLRAKKGSSRVYTYWEDMRNDVQVKVAQKGSWTRSYNISEGNGSKTIDLGGGGSRDVTVTVIDKLTGETIGHSIKFKAFRASIQQSKDSGMLGIPELTYEKDIAEDDPLLLDIAERKGDLEDAKEDLESERDEKQGDLAEIEDNLSEATDAKLEAIRETIPYPRLMITDMWVHNQPFINVKLRSNLDIARVQLVDKDGKVRTSWEEERQGGFPEEEISLIPSPGTLGANNLKDIYQLQLLDKNGNLLDAVRINGGGKIFGEQSNWDDLDSGMMLPEAQQIPADLAILGTDGPNVIFSADFPCDTVHVSMQQGGPMARATLEHEGGQTDMIGTVTFNGANSDPGVYKLELWSPNSGMVLTDIELEWDGENLHVVDSADLWTSKEVMSMAMTVGPVDINNIDSVLRFNLEQQASEKLKDMQEYIDFQKMSFLESVDFYSPAIEDIAGKKLYMESSLYVSDADVLEAFYRKYPQWHPDNFEAHIDAMVLEPNQQWTESELREGALSSMRNLKGTYYGALGSYEERMGEVMLAAINVYVDIRNGENPEDCYQRLRHVLEQSTGQGSGINALAGDLQIFLPTFDEALAEGRRLYDHAWRTRLASQDKDQRVENIRKGRMESDWEAEKEQREAEAAIPRFTSSMPLNQYIALLNTDDQNERNAIALPIITTLLTSNDPRAVRVREDGDFAGQLADALAGDISITESELLTVSNSLADSFYDARDAYSDGEAVSIVRDGAVSGLGDIGYDAEETDSGITFQYNLADSGTVVDTDQGEGAENSYAINPTDCEGECTAIITVEPEKSRNVIFNINSEQFVNFWVEGREDINVSLTITGGDLPANGYSSAKSTYDSGESISLKLTPGEYILQINSTSTDFNTENSPVNVPLRYSFAEYRTQEIIGKMSVPESSQVMDVKMRVAEFDENGERKEDYNAPESEEGINALDPDKPVWIVIHGKDSRDGAPIIDELARELFQQSQEKDFQVITIDWEDAAAYGITIRDAIWVPAAGQWVANQLRNIGFDGSQVNIAGWSHGSYMAYEIGNAMGKVNSIVALDAANNIHTLSQYDVSHVDFARVSQNSIAIDSSIVAGSDSLAQTADTAFQIQTIDPAVNTFTKHKLAVTAFSAILNKERTAYGPFSDHFSLDTIMNRSEPTQEYTHDAYNQSFEGTIVVDTEGVQALPKSILFTDENSDEHSVSFHSIYA